MEKREDLALEVKPCPGGWGCLWAAPCPPQSSQLLSPPSSPLAPQNAADDSAELGDTGERRWWLSLTLPSAGARAKGGWITHKTPSRAAVQAHQQISNLFKHNKPQPEDICCNKLQKST